MAAADLDIKMEMTSLYREEIYTDRRIGTIRALVPVDANGANDTARAVVYVGEAQIMTQMGPLPVSFEIEAKSLSEAVTGYADAAKTAVERTVNELQEMRRQAASSLVLPGQGGGAGFGPSGLGGSGKIQMP
jgi:regulator of protease activity HflC (stomatin/prohibitin superfamily)